MKELPAVQSLLSELYEGGQSLPQLREDTDFMRAAKRFAPKMPEIEVLSSPQFQNPNLIYTGKVSADSVAIFLSETLALEEKGINGNAIPPSTEQEEMFGTLKNELAAYFRHIDIQSGYSPDHAKFILLSSDAYGHYRSVDGGLPHSSLGTAEPITQHLICSDAEINSEFLITAAHEFIHCAEPRLIKFDSILCVNNDNQVEGMALVADVMRGGFSLYNVIFSSTYEALTELIAHGFVQRVKEKILGDDDSQGFSIAYSRDILLLTTCVVGIAEMRGEEELAVWDRAIRSHLTHDMSFYGDLLEYLGESVFRGYALTHHEPYGFDRALSQEPMLKHFSQISKDPRRRMRLLDRHVLPLISHLET